VTEKIENVVSVFVTKSGTNAKYSDYVLEAFLQCLKYNR